MRYVDVGDAAGQRVDNFLLGLLAGVPRSRVYRLLRKGEVRVNGGRVKATYRLRAADRVRIPPLQRSPAPPAPVRVQLDHAQALEAAVIFEDEALLVLNKPAGLAVHGGSGISYGVIEAMRQLRGNDDLELAHRLDRDTSGCLVIAKTRTALRELHGALRDRLVKKSYALLVHGAWPARINTVRFPLQRFVMASGERRVRVSSDGKASRTDFQIVDKAAHGTWLSAFPRTGRTHQIRVHAAASGHPILGDNKYRGEHLRELESTLGLENLCLHAQGLKFTFAGQLRRFSVSPPAHFVSAWTSLIEHG